MVSKRSLIIAIGFAGLFAGSSRNKVCLTPSWWTDLAPSLQHETSFH
jgi:hypothetical protein